MRSHLDGAENTSLDNPIQLLYNESASGGLMGKSRMNTVKRASISMTRPRSMGLEADMKTLARVLSGMQVT